MTSLRNQRLALRFNHEILQVFRTINEKVIFSSESHCYTEEWGVGNRFWENEMHGESQNQIK